MASNSARSLRVLIVSGYFPPFAPMSGVRAGKLAKHLLASGHDVRVLAARDLPFPPLLKPEIPADKIRYARCADINALPKRIAALRHGGAAPAPAGAGASPPSESAAPSSPSMSGALLRKLSWFYTELTNWPDPQIGWLPYAVADGSKLLREFRADLIYATVPPLTGLLVARRLARRFGIPWVAEFRDLWVDHPYYDAPPWRRPLERWQQNRVLGEAAALVTVSDEWRDLLQTRFHKPTATILNGFDPDDYPVEPPADAGRPRELTILYTGTLYPGRRDPTPLFHAVRQLGERRQAVRMHFYGADAGAVKDLANKAGVGELVEVFAPVGYARVVQLQREADILLLLRWNDPSERGVVPGKLFEYAGARRPVLSLGFAEGAVPDIIRSRQLGLVSEDPAEIAAALQRWLDEKARTGRVAPLPLASRDGLSRTDQFRKLEDFLHTALRKGSSQPC